MTQIEMIDLLKVLLGDEIVGSVEQEKGNLCIKLLNGQKFEIMVNEITEK